MPACTHSAAALVLPAAELVGSLTGGDDLSPTQRAGGTDLLETASAQFLQDLSGNSDHVPLPAVRVLAGRVRDGLSRAPPIG